MVVDGGIGKAASVVVGASDVVAGGRIVDGAVLATAALVAGGSALSSPPQAANVSSDDAIAIAAAPARVLGLSFFTW